MEKTTCKTCGRTILEGNLCKNCKSKGSKIVRVGTVLLGLVVIILKGGIDDYIGNINNKNQ